MHSRQYVPGPPSRRENELLDKKTFTAVHADIVFSKVKAKGERKINFEDFKDAVSMVAEMKAGLSDSVTWPHCLLGLAE